MVWLDVKTKHLDNRADSVDPNLGKSKDPHQDKIGCRRIVDVCLVPMLVGEVQTDESQRSEYGERDGVVNRQRF